jgi:hypothetical protein
MLTSWEDPHLQSVNRLVPSHIKWRQIQQEHWISPEGIMHGLGWDSTEGNQCWVRLSWTVSENLTSLGAYSSASCCQTICFRVSLDSSSTNLNLFSWS